MKCIKDITIDEIRSGKNWKLNLPKNLDLSIEQWGIEDKASFTNTDNIVYSAIIVLSSTEQVSAAVLLKEVGDMDYGGDYCVYKNGKWEQLGLRPNPNALPSNEYIANPLKDDPSFNADHDYRLWHHDNFKKFVNKLVHR